MQCNPGIMHKSPRFRGAASELCINNSVIPVWF